MNLLKKVNFLKIKLFKNFLYKIKINSNMSDTKEEVLKFQWKKGDNFGQVVEVEKEDDKFYYFTDGSKIFKEVSPEFLEKVVDGVLPFPGADAINIKRASTAKKTQASIKEEPKDKTVVKPQSELHGLVTKLSKKHVIPFEPRLNLNVISQEMFKMLVESADENPKQLIDTITDVAMDQIEINKLKEYLQQEITNFLNNYYNE